MNVRLARQLPLILFLSALFLIHAAISIRGLEVQSLWFDEGWSAFAAIQPDPIAAWNSDTTNPPLYYVLIHLWAQLAGTSEFSLRFFSLACGLIALALAARLARCLFGLRAAWLTLALLGSAPLFVWAGREARMYTLLACLTLTAALAFDTLLSPARPHRRRGARPWLILWAAELALLYAHNTGPIVALWLNAAALIAWGTATVTRRAVRPVPLAWIAGQIVVGVLWLPYLVTRFLALSSANDAISSAPDGALFARIASALWIAPWERTLEADARLVGVSVGAAALIASGVALSAHRTRPPTLWLLLHTVMLTIGLIGGLAMLGNDLHGRYLVMIAPFFIVAIAGGLSILPGIARWGVVAAWAIIGLLGIYTLNTDTRYFHDDARALVAYEAATLQAGDRALMWSYADRYELAYYWDRLDVVARRITLPEGAPLETVLPLLEAREGEAGGTVSLNVWYTQRADYRGMLGCLLQDETRRPPTAFIVAGMTSLHFPAPDVRAPAFTPFDVTFTDRAGTPIARLVMADISPPSSTDRALCAPLRFELLSSDTPDLKAALILRHADGGEIARTDAIVADAVNRTSSMLNSGASVEAYPLLRFPRGAPPDDYQLVLRLYDEGEHLSGFAPRQPAQTVSGRDLVLTTFRTEQFAPPEWEVASSVDPSPAIDLGTLTLLMHDLPADIAQLRTGDTLPVSLLWRADTPTDTPPLILETADGQRFTLLDSEPISGIIRRWHTLRIPPDAAPGEGAIRLGESGAIIGRVQIEAVPTITEPPPFDFAVDAAFPRIGDLVGYSLSDDPFDAANPPILMLVWRADSIDPAAPAYTVFAQLIDEETVIAQADGPPANGRRPTTGWRADEIVIDAHTLRFNGGAPREDMRFGNLIVGLYDPLTGARVMLTNGADHVELARGLQYR